MQIKKVGRRLADLLYPFVIEVMRFDQSVADVVRVLKSPVAWVESRTAMTCPTMAASTQLAPAPLALRLDFRQ